MRDRVPTLSPRLGRLGALALFAAGGLVLASCSDDLVPADPEIETVRVFPDSSDLRIGDARSLQAVPMDAHSTFVTGMSATWSSDDPQVATVSGDGSVQGVGSGTATITAAVGSMAGHARVRVQPAPAIGVSRSRLDLEKAADGDNPPAETIEITNEGGFELEGLDVGEVTFGPGAEDWLTALIEEGAPATLLATFHTEGVTAAGSYTASIPILSDGASNSPLEVEVTLTVGSGTPAHAEGSGDGQTATVAGPVATPPSVTVTDGFGNPVAGVEVAFAVTGGGGSVTGEAQLTDADGRAAVGAWTLGTTAGTNTLEASVTGIEDPVTFTATGTPDVAAQAQAVAGNNQSAQIGTPVSTPPAVRVDDAHGNPVEGVAVAWEVESGGGSIENADSETDADGVARLEGGWTLGVNVGENTLLATADGAGIAGNPVVFAAEATLDPSSAVPDADESSVSASDATIIASNGSSASTITVTVRDEHGNVIPEASVTLAAEPSSGVQIQQPAGVTDADGRITGAVSGTSVGSRTITATVNASVEVTETASVTIEAAPASISNSLVSATTPITASNTGSTASTRSTVSVTVRDAFGNPRSGHTVTLSVNGSGNTITQPASATDASGQTSGSFHSTVAQTKSVTATISGTGSISQSPSVVVNAAAPASVSVTNHGYSAGVGTSLTLGQRPTYTVRDAFSNVVPNTPVSYASSGGVGYTGASSTNASGQVTLSSWTMGGTAGDDSSGRMANTVTLFATAGSGSATATNYGIYRWAANVAPLVSTGSSCANCHTFNRNPNTLVNVAPTLSPCSSTSFVRVVAGNANSSVLYSKLASSSPLCGSRMGSGGANAGTFFTAAQLKIVRAWINNGALDN